MNQKSLTATAPLPDYKLGVPLHLQALLFGGIGLGVLGLVIAWLLSPSLLWLTVLLVVIGLLALALTLLLGRVTSSQVRMAARQTMMEAVTWRGDEQVLDVGCGNGFLLLTAAKKLTTGKAIGIDLWQEEAGAQTAQAVWHNAQLEGVRDRIDVQAIDARRLPFADETFDVILSSLALHHIGGDADRQQALQEMIRVLKPGGQILLYDFFLMTGQAATIMRQAELTQVNWLRGHLLRVIAAHK